MPLFGYVKDFEKNIFQFFHFSFFREQSHFDVKIKTTWQKTNIEILRILENRIIAAEFLFRAYNYLV